MANFFRPEIESSILHLILPQFLNHQNERFSQIKIQNQKCLTKKPPQRPILTKKPPQRPILTKKPPQRPILTKKPPLRPILTKKPPLRPILTKKLYGLLVSPTILGGNQSHMLNNVIMRFQQFSVTSPGVHKKL